MPMHAKLRKWGAVIGLQAAILSSLVCLTAPAFAADSSWKKLKSGDSEKDVLEAFGEPKEQRGNKLLYGPKGNLKQMIVEMENKKLVRFTVHFLTPAKSEDLFDSKEKFEALKSGPKLSRQRIRMIGLPEKGWVIEQAEDHKIRSISVEKVWKPKASLLSWAEAVALAWADKK